MEIKVYSTGNATVDAVGKINLSGNVTPPIWYKTIAKENGKPDMRAIAFLSDIIYWYRPTEIRDESTGELLGFKKKFKKEMLQRSYNQLAEQFGCSKREAQTTIVFLEKMGLIERVFKKEVVGRMVLNNVMYIRLNADKLKEITYIMPSTEKGETLFQENVIPSTEKGETLFQENVIPSTEKGEALFQENVIPSTGKDETLPQENVIPSTGKSKTNTYTSTHTSSKTSSKTIHQSITEMIDEAEIKKFSLWKEKSKGYFLNEDLEYLYKNIVYSLCEMVSNKHEKYNANEVINTIKSIVNSDENHDLSNYIDVVMTNYTERLKVMTIKNPQEYLKKIMFNALSDYRLQYDAICRKMGKL